MVVFHSFVSSFFFFFLSPIQSTEQEQTASASSQQPRTGWNLYVPLHRRDTSSTLVHHKSSEWCMSSVYRVLSTVDLIITDKNKHDCWLFLIPSCGSNSVVLSASVLMGVWLKKKSLTAVCILSSLFLVLKELVRRFCESAKLVQQTLILGLWCLSHCNKEVEAAAFRYY